MGKADVMEVPGLVTQEKHPELYKLLASRRSTYIKVSVKKMQVLHTTGCGYVRGDWVAACTPTSQDKYSIYRYDGSLLATNEGRWQP